MIYIKYFQYLDCYTESNVANFFNIYNVGINFFIIFFICDFETPKLF